ncbi:MAG: pre-peptidase C-terminal domain-containing protein [Anaerolineae bacterium]|nr:pre-peptidase C-terminal domain-containing protein [Anaerolineae bacterium]
MHRRRTVGLLTSLALLCLFVGIVLAQGSPAIRRWVFGGGTSHAETGGNVSISSAFSQSIAGTSSGGDVVLVFGFWGGGKPPTALPGDGYEPDDICSAAKAISTDGSAQLHTFHKYADEDWARFDALAGRTYIIQTANPGEEADTVLSLYDGCVGGSLLGSDDNAFGRSVRIVWTALSAGTYYVQVSNHDPAQYGLNAGYELSVRLQQAGLPVAIVVGGHDDAYSLQANIAHCTNRAYQLFREGGLSDDNIYYLSPDAQSGRDDDATSANLAYALTTWAASKAGPGVALYVYMIDHGGVDTFVINGSSDTVTASELDGWLSSLESASGADTINVFIEACLSGSFVDGLHEISKPGRVIITSAASDQNAYASSDGAYFSDVFLTALSESQDLYTSFTVAQEAVEATGLWQEPWLDDNGNNTGNDSSDGDVARGRGLAAFFAERPPVIDTVSVPSVIPGPVGAIQAEVRDDIGVSRVWAVLYPPSFEEPAPGDITPELDLPEVTLTDGNSDGTYDATYSGFDERGSYQLVVYAEDGAGKQAIPQSATVRVGYEIYLPLVLNQD